jgi:hypothetical protein
MHAYRLKIGPDGSVIIPDGEPGQIVTVLMEASWELTPAVPFKPVADMRSEEREALKQEFLERGRLVRSRLSGQIPIDHGAEIYGEDGLPR